MAVQANELRIGNLTYVSGSKKINVIEPIDFYNYHEDPTYFDAQEPIPLTPEILEKCGFEKFNGYSVFRGGRYVIIPMSNAYTIFLNKLESAPDKMELITGFKSLHQLQNLYWCLVGKELPITL